MNSDAPASRTIQILLPVWGAALHARLPGALPAVPVGARERAGTVEAWALHIRIVGAAGDAEVIERSPLWKLLLGCCSVRVRYIDDLISQSSSTVLTLAYALAIREAGEQALDTCFVPLVADYVLSDGSLLAVVKRIFAGASGGFGRKFSDCP